MTTRHTPAHVPLLDPAIVKQARDDLRDLRADPWFKPGRWSVSPRNFDRENLPPASTPSRITISDISGRVIEQMPGIGFSVAEKVALARHLADAGVPEMHAVYGINLPKMQAHVRAIRDAGIPIKVIALAITADQVRVAADAGVQLVEIETMGRPSLHSALTGSRVDTEDELLEYTTDAIRVAKSLGLEVRADINDVGYAQPAFMKRFAQLVASEHVDFVHIADSSSSLSPRAIASVVRLVKAAVGTIPVGVHIHNDFGTAVAAAIAAMEAGAEVFDTSVNGIGEKAGQLDLATFAVAVEAYYGVQTGIRLNELTELSRFVADLSRSPMPVFTPIVGTQAFTSAVEHLQIPERLVDEFFARSIAPHAVGNGCAYPVGRHTGHFGLLSEAERLGIPVYEDQVEPLLAALDDWFELHKRPITDEELSVLLTQRGGVHE